VTFFFDAGFDSKRRGRVFWESGPGVQLIPDVENDKRWQMAKKSWGNLGINRYVPTTVVNEALKAIAPMKITKYANCRCQLYRRIWITSTKRSSHQFKPDYFCCRLFCCR